MFRENFRFDELKEAALMLEQEKKCLGNKTLVVFRKKSFVFSRKRKRLVNKISVIFFTDKYLNRLCYTTTGRKGFLVSDAMEWQNIEKLVVRFPDPLDPIREREKLFQRIQRARYDEQTWSNLKPEDFTENKHPFFYLSKVFSPHEIEQIEKAFREKASFRIERKATSPRGRDYRAQGCLGADGIYRAWFSSEYAGCLN